MYKEAIQIILRWVFNDMPQESWGASSCTAKVQLRIRKKCSKYTKSRWTQVQTEWDFVVFFWFHHGLFIQGGFLFLLKDKVSGSLALNLLDSQGWAWTRFLRDCKLSQWAPAWLRPRVTWDKDINWRITFISWPVANWEIFLSSFSLILFCFVLFTMTV